MFSALSTSCSNRDLVSGWSLMRSSFAKLTLATAQTASMLLNSQECGGGCRPLKCSLSFYCDTRLVWAEAPS